MADDDVRMLVLEGVARQARGSQPTSKWLGLWRDAIAPLSPEEVRAWCRLQWERATSQPTEESVLLAAFWGIADVAALGTPAVLADWAWRLHKGGQTRLTHAAIYALGVIAAADDPQLSDDAIGQLQRLKSRIRHRQTTKRIDQALGAVAAARGLDPEALADLVVEDADLAPDGSRVWAVGPHDLYLFLTDDGDVELATLERDTGRAVGPPPRSVRNEHFAAYNEAKAIQKVLAETLATQKHRLELALESQRVWTWPAWRRVFGRHPLMKHLATRLVWCLSGPGAAPVTAMIRDDRWQTLEGVAVGPGPETELKVVHPVDLEPESLAGWQRQVVTRRLIQPFKQLFREVYRPSVAELALRRSERYAGMVIRHRQMYALLRARGWSGLAGIGPTGYLGLKEVPGAGLTAVIGFRQFRHYQDRQRRQVVLTGVEFLPNPLPDRPPGTELRIPLAGVGAVPYSEVMRDLALVVGVAGLGHADQLRGDDERGPGVPPELLAGQLEMRKSLVRELLPLLGLEQQVQLEGDHALVRAVGRTFRLNLGTGVVTLAEDGRVLDLDGIERSDGPLYLPFEGGDAATSAVLATLVWLGKFGRIS